MKITIKKDERRGDYEVLNMYGSCMGFVWKSSDCWMCRVGERVAENFDTYDQAIVQARKLATRDDIVNLVKSAQAR